MPCRSARTYKVGGNDSLAVSRLERMKCAQTRGDQSSREQHPEAQLTLRRDQFGEVTAWSILRMSRGRRWRSSRCGHACGRGLRAEVEGSNCAKRNRTSRPHTK